MFKAPDQLRHEEIGLKRSRWAKAFGFKPMFERRSSDAATFGFKPMHVRRTSDVATFGFKPMVKRQKIGPSDSDLSLRLMLAADCRAGFGFKA